MDEETNQTKANEVNKQSAEASGSANGQPDAPKKPEKKKRGQGVKIAIAALIVAIIAGGAVAAYNMWYQNPDRVIGNAISNALQADSNEVDAHATIRPPADEDVPFSEIALRVQGAGGHGVGSYTGSLELNMNDADNLSLDGDVRVDDEGDIYARVDGIADLLEAVAGTETGAPGLFDAYFDVIASEVDNTWIRINSDELEDVSEDLSRQQVCTAELFERLEEDRELSREVINVYRSNIFISVDDTLGSEGGSLGYVVSLDYDTLKTFVERFNETEFATELAACLDEDEALIDPAEIDRLKENAAESDADVRVELWVSRWSHNLTAVHVSIEGDDGTTANLHADTSWNVEHQVETPNDSVGIEELLERIQTALIEAQTEAFRELYGVELEAELQT